jgi:hypothetical protein
MAAEVTTLPNESVARAVTAVGPEAAGVQARVNGALVTVPTGTPEARNSTWVIIAPAVAAAEAVRFTAVPTTAVELLAGAVSETLVATTPVTVTPEEVAVPPKVSVTRAVRVVLPAVGVHLTEYTPPTGVVTVPMTEEPARNWT